MEHKGRFYYLFTIGMMLCSSVLAHLNVPSGATISNPAGGYMDMGCSDLNVLGRFNLNSSQVSNIANISVGPGGYLNGDQGTLTVSGNWNNNGTFVPGTGTVVLTDGCAPGPFQIVGNNVFNNLTLSSTNGSTIVIPADANITVNGVLNLQGTSGQPISLVSSTGQLVNINLGPSAQVISNFVNVSNNVQIGRSALIPAIPTLSEYGLILLAMLIVCHALWRGRIIRLFAKRKNPQH
jgi:hypothetical protein